MAKIVHRYVFFWVIKWLEQITKLFSNHFPYRHIYKFVNVSGSTCRPYRAPTFLTQEKDRQGKA